MLKQDLRNYKFPIALDSQLCSKLDTVTDIEIYDSAQEDDIPEDQTIMNKWDRFEILDLIKDLHTPLDILLEKISDWKIDDGKAHLKFADDVLGMNIKN